MFFSVKRAMIIGGKVYYPCICYEISPSLEKTVAFLKNKGKAEIYPIKVHFQNGKVIENLDVKVTKRKFNRTSKPKNSDSKGISIPERLDQRLKTFSEEAVETKTGFKGIPITEELGQKLRALPEVEDDDL